MSGLNITDAEWAKRWPNFTRDEMCCKGTQTYGIEPEFLDKLQSLRNIHGKPIIISSGYRAPVYNDLVSKTGLNGPHTTGRAVDIRIFGREFHRLLALASQMFTGIGISQKGPYKSRFLHLDDLEDEPRCPRPWVWTY